MIIIHQTNVSAYAGAHTWYWIGHPLLVTRISETSAAAAGPSPGLRTLALTGAGI